MYHSSTDQDVSQAKRQMTMGLTITRERNIACANTIAQPFNSREGGGEMRGGEEWLISAE